MCKAAYATGYVIVQKVPVWASECKQLLKLLMVGVLPVNSKLYKPQVQCPFGPGQRIGTAHTILGNKREKPFLSTLQVCLLYSAGELSLIEYGQNEILGTCRTEHMSPYLISVRINPPRGNLAEEKKMAYLVDKQTAKVADLQAGVVLATVSHGAKIDWLVRPAVISLCYPIFALYDCAGSMPSKAAAAFAAVAFFCTALWQAGAAIKPHTCCFTCNAAALGYVM